MKYKLFLAYIVLFIILAVSLYRLFFPIREGQSYKCADEGGWCRCPYGTVVYGKHSTWTKYKEVKGWVRCDDNEFGDPYPVRPAQYDSKGNVIRQPPRPRKECICTPGCLYEQGRAPGQSGSSGVTDRGSGVGGSNSLAGVGRGAPIASASPSNENCTNTTIDENTVRIKEATEKLNEWKKVNFDLNTRVKKNFKQIKKNMRKAWRMASIASGSESDDDDACAAHSEACGQDPNSSGSASSARVNSVVGKGIQWD